MRDGRLFNFVNVETMLVCHRLNQDLFKETCSCMVPMLGMAFRGDEGDPGQLDDRMSF